MTEENNQGQATPSEANEGAQDSQKTSKQQQSYRQSDEEQRQVSYERFAQVNKTNKELERELADLRAKEEQEAEDRAKKQGEFERLYRTEQQKTQNEKQKRQAAEQALVRYKRMTTWRDAAREIIRAEALDDAFEMLDEEDFAGMDDADTQGMTRLAEVLADRKPYLSEGPRGAGSGFGSRTPVLQRPSTQLQQNSQGAPSIRKILKKPKRRQWK